MACRRSGIRIPLAPRFFACLFDEKTLTIGSESWPELRKRWARIAVPHAEGQGLNPQYCDVSCGSAGCHASDWLSDRGEPVFGEAGRARLVSIRTGRPAGPGSNRASSARRTNRGRVPRRPAPGQPSATAQATGSCRKFSRSSGKPAWRRPSWVIWKSWPCACPGGREARRTGRSGEAAADRRRAGAR
jgi:hypothetical protein